MLKFLEALTGINGVISDPYHSGGVHQIKPGGNLEVHANFNFHPELKLDCRINVLVYLNKDWKEEYRGHFELWNREMTAPEQKILPLFMERAGKVWAAAARYLGETPPRVRSHPRRRCTIQTCHTFVGNTTALRRRT
jgi:hypothetical protein